ncbi:unnamed protein product [Amoebophrya sp. A25]|nr:unnamed protein product [Amoebophrya sp. A25]|eukprot:GSA25T00013899001.1
MKGSCCSSAARSRPTSGLSTTTTSGPGGGVRATASSSIFLMSSNTNTGTSAGACTYSPLTMVAGSASAPSTSSSSSCTSYRTRRRYFSSGVDRMRIPRVYIEKRPVEELARVNEQGLPRQQLENANLQSAIPRRLATAAERNAYTQLSPLPSPNLACSRLTDCIYRGQEMLEDTANYKHDPFSPPDVDATRTTSLTDQTVSLKNGSYRISATGVRMSGSNTRFISEWWYRHGASENYSANNAMLASQVDSNGVGKAPSVLGSGGPERCVLGGAGLQSGVLQHALNDAHAHDPSVVGLQDQAASTRQLEQLCVLKQQTQNAKNVSGPNTTHDGPNSMTAASSTYARPKRERRIFVADLLSPSVSSLSEEGAAESEQRVPGASGIIPPALDSLLDDEGKSRRSTAPSRKDATRSITTSRTVVASSASIPPPLQPMRPNEDRLMHMDNSFVTNLYPQHPLNFTSLRAVTQAGITPLDRAVRDVPWESRFDLVKRMIFPKYCAPVGDFTRGAISRGTGTPRRAYQEGCVEGVRVRPTFNPFVDLSDQKRYVLDNWPSRNWFQWEPNDNVKVRGGRRSHQLPRDIAPTKDELGEWHPCKLPGRYKADIKKQYAYFGLPWVWDNNFMNKGRHIYDRSAPRKGRGFWRAREYRKLRIADALRKMPSLIEEYRKERRESKRLSWFEDMMVRFCGKLNAHAHIRKRKRATF